MRTISRRIVTAYIVSADDKILLGRKKAGGVYVDYLHNPGGGVEEGESDNEALRREVLEETAIDIATARVSLIDNQGHGEAVKTLSSGEKVLVKMQFNVYKAELEELSDAVKVIAGDDLDDLQWFDLNDLESINFTPPAKEQFQRIGTDWLTSRQGLQKERTA
jgi:8-oxo-dGTP pyrophosphatase MutT (NUDIX family)